MPHDTLSSRPSGSAIGEKQPLSGPRFNSFSPVRLTSRHVLPASPERM
jgi:hypothetical protein